MKLEDVRKQKEAEGSVYGEEAESFIEECTHFVVFTEPRDGSEYFYHAVGFQSEPDEHNIKHVCEEMRDDPEFGVGDKVNDLNVKLVSGDEAEYVKKMLRGEDIE